MNRLALVTTLLFYIITVTMINKFAYAQPDTLWTKTYGGSLHEDAVSVQQTTDGGFIIAGATESFSMGEQDVWVIKTDESGDTLWTKVFGGTGYDWATSVRQTTDGGYIAIGATESYSVGFMDIWVIKMDTSGDTLWTKTFGGNDFDYGYSIEQTNDGGYIIVGHTTSYGAGNYDTWLIKTNASGDTTWTKTFGGIGRDWAFQVQQTTDGGYILIGETDPLGINSYDVWLIKTDVGGDTMWTKTFNGSESDRGISIQQTLDGGYIITGYTGRNSAMNLQADMWLLKTDASGDTIWTKVFGGVEHEAGHSVQQTSDGGFIIAGNTFSFGAGLSDFWLIKTDSLGDTTWTTTYGGSGSDICQSAQQTTDGGYIMTGYTESYGAGDFDIWLIRIASDSGVVSVESDMPVIPIQFTLKQNYPNPFNPSTTINYFIPTTDFVQLSIYDALGRLVRILINEKRFAGEHSIVWDGKDENGKFVSSGIYYYSLNYKENNLISKQMLLIK